MRRLIEFVCAASTVQHFTYFFLEFWTILEQWEVILLRAMAGLRIKAFIFIRRFHCSTSFYSAATHQPHVRINLLPSMHLPVAWCNEIWRTLRSIHVRNGTLLLGPENLAPGKPRSPIRYHITNKMEAFTHLRFVCVHWCNIEPKENMTGGKKNSTYRCLCIHSNGL